MLSSKWCRKFTSTPGRLLVLLTITLLCMVRLYFHPSTLERQCLRLASVPFEQPKEDQVSTLLFWTCISVSRPPFLVERRYFFRSDLVSRCRTWQKIGRRPCGYQTVMTYQELTRKLTTFTRKRPGKRDLPG